MTRIIIVRKKSEQNSEWENGEKETERTIFSIETDQIQYWTVAGLVSVAAAT